MRDPGGRLGRGSSLHAVRLRSIRGADRHRASGEKRPRFSLRHQEAVARHRSHHDDEPRVGRERAARHQRGGVHLSAEAVRGPGRDLDHGAEGPRKEGPDREEPHPAAGAGRAQSQPVFTRRVPGGISCRRRFPLVQGAARVLHGHGHEGAASRQRLPDARRRADGNFESGGLPGPGDRRPRLRLGGNGRRDFGQRGDERRAVPGARRPAEEGTPAGRVGASLGELFPIADRPVRRHPDGPEDPGGLQSRRPEDRQAVR